MMMGMVAEVQTLTVLEGTAQLSNTSWGHPATNPQQESSEKHAAWCSPRMSPDVPSHMPGVWGQEALPGLASLDDRIQTLRTGRG